MSGFCFGHLRYVTEIKQKGTFKKKEKGDSCLITTCLTKKMSFTSLVPINTAEGGPHATFVEQWLAWNQFRVSTWRQAEAQAAFNDDSIHTTLIEVD